MVCGWDKGYFGIQELSNRKKVLIFSVWDSPNNDKDATPEEKRTKLLHKDDKTRVARFGGEGSGGQSFYALDWKIGQPIQCKVTATPNGERTEYRGEFLHPETKAWVHMTTFSTITGGKSLSGFHSFVEDFKRDRASADKQRSARFGNGRVLPVDSETWVDVTRAVFTADGNPDKRVNAGIKEGFFFLSTGGETEARSDLLRTKIVLPKVATR